MIRCTFPKKKALGWLPNFLEFWKVTWPAVNPTGWCFPKSGGRSRDSTGVQLLSTQGFPFQIFQLFPASGGFLETLHRGAGFFFRDRQCLSGCNKGQGGVLLINIQMAMFVAKVSTMSWGHFFWWSDCYPFVGPCGVRLFLSEDEGHLAWMDQSIEPRYSWVGNDKCGMYNIL